MSEDELMIHYSKKLSLLRGREEDVSLINVKVCREDLVDWLSSDDYNYRTAILEMIRGICDYFQNQRMLGLTSNYSIIRLVVKDFCFEDASL